MLIDTDDKTVTFKAGETLTLDELWALIDILDEPLTSLFPEADLDEGRIPASAIYRIYVVPSQSKSYTYAVVLFVDGSWACSCPDWVHRRSKEDTASPCKHILRLHFAQVF